MNHLRAGVAAHSSFHLRAIGRASPSNSLRPLFLGIHGVRWLFSARRASLGPRQGRPRPFPGFPGWRSTDTRRRGTAARPTAPGRCTPPSRVGADPQEGARDSLQPRALGPRFAPGSYLTNRDPGRSCLWPPAQAVRPPPHSCSSCSPWRGRSGENSGAEGHGAEAGRPLVARGGGRGGQWDSRVPTFF